MKTFLIVAAILLPAHLFADDFAAAVAHYDSNQKSIVSFVGTGTMEISIYSTATSSLLRTVSSNLTVYMKSPDKVRFNISSQGGNFEMVQIGDLITQKVAGTNTLATSKATNSTDLFKKYFNVGISANMQNVKPFSSGIISDQGRNLQKFSVRTPPTSSAGSSSLATGGTPDETDYYFNSDSMLVRLVSLSNGAPLAQTDYSFQKYGNIFVATSLTTTVFSKGTKVITATQYSAASVNTVVSDKEFELR